MPRSRMIWCAISVVIVGAVVGCMMLAHADDAPPPKPPATTQSLKDAKDVNVKYMLRGYCIAGSRIRDTDALGGFGPSDNFPWSLPDSLKDQPAGVFLHVATNEEMPFAREYQGMALYLGNKSDQRAAFSASDSRLSIVQEAQDPAGNWKAIEYLPSSWCGNSYHRVLLDPGQCWRFAVPKYTGSVKTKLRFALLPGRDQTKPIYSNEFEGSINPEQFTAKQGHTPSNIMDPYNE